MIHDDRTKNIFSWCLLVVLLLLVGALNVELFFVLEPSAFDLVLELTAFGVPPKVPLGFDLNNVRPQLGQLTFLLTGAFGYLWGAVGEFAVRYGLFTLSLMMLYLVYRQMVSDKIREEANINLLFALSALTSFFATIKFFYVVDFQISLLLSFVVLYLAQIKAGRGWLATVFFLALYCKFAIIVFLLPAFLIISDKYILQYYAKPILFAFVVSLTMFWFKGIDGVLEMRGLFLVLKQPSSVVFAVKNILFPWHFFDYFDQSRASFDVALDGGDMLKLMPVVMISGLMLFKGGKGTLLDIFIVIFAVIGIVGIQPFAPWLHDYGFYCGAIGLLCLLVLWKNQQIFKFKSVWVLLVLGVFLDLHQWNRHIMKLDIKEGKLSLKRELLLLARKGQVNEINFYCSNNVGEFDWEMRQSKVRTSLNYVSSNDKLQEPRPGSSLHLVPRKCLHENVKPPIFSVAPFKAVYLNRDESYDVILL